MATSTQSAAGDDAPVVSRSASTIAVAAVGRGYHDLNIDGYSRLRTKGIVINSCKFAVQGYKWRIACYTSGVTQECADYVSVFLEHVSPVEEGVAAEFQIALLDSHGRAAPSYSCTAKHTFKEHEATWGWWKFIGREELEESGHLRNDSFTIRCDLTVLEEVRVEEPAAEKKPFVEVPPSNMPWNRGNLLRTHKFADITFKAGEEKFAAHRCVLASRSPLLMAELSGSMEEKADARCMCIDGIDAAACKALLHFIYTDELPRINEEDAVVIAQNLLIAAVRYDLGRLKLMCEDKLCECLDVKTAATTLALAEQLHCHGLKKATLRFVGLPRNMKAVMATDGYESLMRSCPSVCKELMSKLVGHWI